MIGDLLKIVVVALTFPLIALAELSFNTEYYHAVQCAVMISIACISVFAAIKTKSRLLLMYAAVYVSSGLIFALTLIPRLSYYCDYIFYESMVNFSLIIQFADCFIISIGGISVSYRIYCLRRFGSSGDDIFDARMGLYKWAR